MTKFVPNGELRIQVSMRISLCAAMIALFIVTTGCTNKVDTQISAHRARITIDNKPDGATTLADAKTAVKEQASVTISGRADLTALTAGNDGKAVMMVREVLEDNHSHGTAKEASSCPFCKRRMENAPKAVVEFVDSAGKTLPYSVEKLFAINDGDLVVVRGEATFDESIDMLKIKAGGLYIGGN